MQILGAFVSWALAAVLMSSGALKLGRHRAFFKSMQTLGLPAPLLRDYTFARAFPYLELTLGALILLLPGAWAVIPLALATALFVAFLVIIGRAARSGVPASCNCFGGLGADAVGPRTVARNVGFVLLALLALLLHTAPASVAADRFGGWAYPLPAVLAAVVAAALVLYRNRVEHRAQRSLTDNLVVTNRAGEQLPIRELQDPPSYVVFFSPGCGACSQTVQEFRWWPHAMAEGYDLVPVFAGTPEQFALFPEFEPLLDYAWYDPQMEFYRAVGGSGTPAGTLIDADHPLGNGAFAGITALRELIWTPEFTRQRQHESEIRRDDEAREMARQALVDGGWDPAWVDYAEITLTNDDGRQITVQPAPTAEQQTKEGSPSV